MLETIPDKKYSFPEGKINSIVATGIRGKKPYILKFEDYSEDVLVSIVKNNKFKSLFIDHRFWNYKYCRSENLRIENIYHMYKIPEDILVDPQKLYTGLITINIMYYSVLHNSLKVVGEKIFKTYLHNLNIDRKDFGRFLKEKEIYLPLTQNFISLLERVFRKNDIIDYLFPESRKVPFYDYDQMEKILSYFKVDDIRTYVEYIYDSQMDLEQKYKYISLVMEYFDGDIDDYEKVYITTDEKDKPVGYYLSKLEPTDELFELYRSVLEKYKAFNGAERFETI